MSQPSNLLLQYTRRAKAKKMSGKTTERFARAQLISACPYCERQERKQQNFHDVADASFQNGFMLPTTYKCLPLSAKNKKNFRTNTVVIFAAVFFCLQDAAFFKKLLQCFEK